MLQNGQLLHNGRNGRETKARSPFALHVTGASRAVTDRRVTQRLLAGVRSLPKNARPGDLCRNSQHGHAGIPQPCAYRLIAYRFCPAPSREQHCASRRNNINRDTQQRDSGAPSRRPDALQTPIQTTLKSRNGPKHSPVHLAMLQHTQQLTRLLVLPDHSTLQLSLCSEPWRVWAVVMPRRIADAIPKATIQASEPFHVLLAQHHRRVAARSDNISGLQ